MNKDKIEWKNIKKNDIVVWHSNANKLVLITEPYSEKRHLAIFLRKLKIKTNSVVKEIDKNGPLNSLSDNDVDLLVAYLQSKDMNDFFVLSKKNDKDIYLLDTYLMFKTLAFNLLNDPSVIKALEDDHHERYHRGVQLVDGKSRVSSSLKEGQGWLIHDGDPLEKPERYTYSLATDDDIVSEIASKIDSHSIVLNNHKVVINEEGVSLFDVGFGESFIYLEKDEVYKLKDFLNKMI
jgi:hypothetical protein